MAMSPSGNVVRVLEGDLLKSEAQTLVNAVNTAGAMGKGIALAFRRKFPEMYEDYVRRCDAGDVRLGEPYPYVTDGRIIINFPTKGHWRAASKLDDIIAGLEHLIDHHERWGVTSTRFRRSAAAMAS